MKQNDKATREWVTEWLNAQDWVITATTFNDENYGADITYTTSAGTFNAELKSQRKYHYEAWTTASTNVSLYNVPRKSDTQDTFKNELEGFHRFDTPKSAECPEAFDGKQFFFLNADLKDGRFMVPSFPPKWLKMLRDKQSLIILYKDGLYIMSNEEIRKKFLGYIRYKETEWTNVTALHHPNGYRPRWGIKAAIDLSDSEFLEVNDIPSELFELN